MLPDDRAPRTGPAPAPRGAFAPAEIAGARAPMVGRDAALQRLIARFYEIAEGGEARLLIVSGPPGIGKSRLAHELLRAVADLPEPAQALLAQAEPLAAARPYDLLRQLVASQFAIREGAPPDEAAARLAGGAADLLGQAGPEVAALIAQLVGIAPSAPGADPRQAQVRGLRALRQGLAALARRGPVLLVLDNLHDADDGSLAAIEELARSGRGLPLLAIGLAQPRLFDRRPAWAEPAPWLERLDLGPLTEHDVRLLVGEILRKAGKLPPELRALVVQHAEGNPRYVEELIKAMVAERVIVPGPDAWQIVPSRLPRLRVPASLAELLRARVLALGAAEQGLLARAATVGRSFWPGALAALEPAAAPAEPILAALCADGIIAPRPESRFAGEPEYSFPHAAAHEAAYAMAPAERLPGWHERAAAWLSERGASPGLVARHLERAGQAEAAGRHYLCAGAEAAGTYAVDAGIEQYRRALRLLPAGPESAPERILALEALGHLLRERAQLGEAVEAYRRMAELAGSSGDLAAEARAWFSLARAQDEQTETRAAQESALLAVDLAERAGAPELRALALVQLSVADIRLGRPREARARCEEALAIAAGPAGRPARALALAYLGLTYEQTAEWGAARACLAEAIALNRELDDARELAYQLSNLGFVCNAAAEHEAALEALRESVRVAGEAGSRMVEIFALSNIGTALNALGAHAEAEAEMRRGLELSRLARIEPFPDFYRGLALACLGQGRAGEAVEAAQEGLALARREEDPREIAASWRVLGTAIAALDDHQGAPPCFAESARILGELGAQAELGRTLRAWSAYEARHGDQARAAERLQAAREQFAAAGLARELEQTGP